MCSELSECCTQNRGSAMTGQRIVRQVWGPAFAVAVLLLTTLVAPVDADERLEGIACRSVHLGYEAPSATAFYNEVEVQQSAVGSFFMVCGWQGGYFGLQELANGKKLLIFSVWDQHQGNNPKDVPEDQRVKLVYQDPAMRIGRFGGEGTGGQSFLDFDWKAGETYRLLLRAKLVGDRSEYAGWFFLPEEKAWKHLVTFSTLNKGKLIEGCYSFVEDFRRNRVSATQARTALFSNGWVCGSNDNWQLLVKAQFTADENPATNIDAGLDGGRFFLATGGTTENKHTPLWKKIERSIDGLKPPVDLPK